MARLPLSGVFLSVLLWTMSLIKIEGKTSMENKRALLNQLFGGSFDSSFRPVINETDPLVVTMVYTPEQIVGLDESRQILSTAAFVQMRWRDQYLRWNASEFGGIQVLILDSKKIWTPPIVLRNSANKGHFMVDTIVSVFNDGSILWYALVNLNTVCTMDFFFFPVDTQICTQEFEMRIPAGLIGMDYLTLQLDEETSIPNMRSINAVTRHWELIGMRVYTEEDLVSIVPSFIVVAELHLHRKSFFYLMNFVIPCGLIFLLTLFGFLLPPDSGEKVGLSVTIILVCNAMAYMIPEAASGVSMLALVNILTMILVAVFTGMNVIVLRYWHRSMEGHEVPGWMKTLVFKYMAKVLCMKKEYRTVTVLKRGAKSCRRNSGVFNNGSRGAICVYSEGTCDRRLLENDVYELKNIANQRTSCTAHSQDDLSAPMMADVHTVDDGNNLNMGSCSKKLDDIERSLKYLVMKSIEDEKDGNIAKEWKKVAMVLNRFFLFTYIALCLLALLYLFLEISYVRRRQPDKL
ncbi:acetylcholine receptor subunit beta-like [Ptychodera flava]|uniref:acetylcholine receptor subunit beta-like n=1 Tax=Ptychodera flava TaxID=63121 RepID=UPI003969FE54